MLTLPCYCQHEMLKAHYARLGALLFYVKEDSSHIKACTQTPSAHKYSNGSGFRREITDELGLFVEAQISAAESKKRIFSVLLN